MESRAALLAAADRADAPAYPGVVLTSDLFYPSKALGQDWSVWEASHVIGVEMEVATLLVIAALAGHTRGQRSGGRRPPQPLERGHERIRPSP